VAGRAKKCATAGRSAWNRPPPHGWNLFGELFRQQAGNVYFLHLAPHSYDHLIDGEIWLGKFSSDIAVAKNSVEMLPSASLPLPFASFDNGMPQLWQ
jgi:hypothetical protein